MKLIHFSDVHVQLPGWRKRRDLGALRMLATVELWKGRGKLYDDALEKLRRIAALEADHFVCTGDLTQLAMQEEFALAAEALAPIRDKLTLIHGNHDRYPLGTKPNRGFEEAFGEQPRVKHVGDVAFISVDSCGALCWPVVTRGHVHTQQLRADLKANEGRCRVVLVHHAPVLRDGKRDWPWHALDGAREFLAATAEADAVLCGHIHDRYRCGNVINAGSSTENGHEGYWELHVENGKLVDARQRTL